MLLLVDPGLKQEVIEAGSQEKYDNKWSNRWNIQWTLLQMKLCIVGNEKD